MDERSRDQVPRSAIKQVVEEIAAKEDFTPDEALDLAGRFFAYDADVGKDEQDMLGKLEVQLKGDIGGESWRKSRMETEGALFRAQNGDYAGIKDLLRKLSTEQAGLGMYTGIYDTPHLWQTFPKKLARMAEVLPDRGKPYLPPLPPVVKR